MPFARNCTPDELDALGTLVSAGDRTREGELADALLPCIRNVVAAYVRKHPRNLTEHRKDLTADARLAAAACVRKYRPGEGRLTTYVSNYVRLELKAPVRALLSHVPANLGVAPLDFDDPLFRAYQPLHAPVSDDALFGDSVAADEAVDAGLSMAAARHLLKKRLLRLSADEREVTLALWGVGERRASQNTHAAEESRAKALTLKQVARRLDRPIGEVEALHRRAVARLRIG